VTGPTTIAERFSALRQRIRAFDASYAGDGIREQVQWAIAEELKQLEQIVSAADELLHANTANTKHEARTKLHARLSIWRRWSGAGQESNG